MATIVPQGLEPTALTKGQAEAVLNTRAEAHMGHVIEVAFDFGEQPTWYHGEICGVAVDKIRVRYYYDNTRHWHPRFLMEHHGMEMSPVLVQAAAGAAALASAGWVCICKYIYIERERERKNNSPRK